MPQTRISTRLRHKRKCSPVKLTVKHQIEKDKTLLKRRKAVKQERDEFEYNYNPEADVDDIENGIDDEDLKCHLCSKSFLNRKRLIKHIHTAHRSRPLVCVCHGNTYKSARNLNLHEETVMKGTSVSRKNYRKYSQEALLTAYETVKENKMSIRKAAKKFHIPFTTLLDRVAGRTALDKTSSGPKPLLNSEDEKMLCSHVCFMSAIGYGYTRSAVTSLASELAVYKDVLEYGKVLSDSWYRKFVRRWPNVAKKIKSKSKQYIASMDIMQIYFQEYIYLLQNNTLLNIPQKLFCVTIYEIDLCSINRKYENFDSKAKKPIDLVSVILCCCASGNVLAPFLVFNGTSSCDNLVQDSLPCVQARVSYTGHVNRVIFKDYFKQHFLKYLHSTDESGPVIVLYNGNEFHFTVERIDWASKHNMMLFPLPPHTAKYEGSLNKDINAMFHLSFTQEVKRYKKNNFDEPVTKHNICKIICNSFSSAFAPRSLTKLFKQSAVCPVDPELLDSSVKFYDVASLDDNIHDNIDSTGSFFTTRLPIPNVANRVNVEYKHQSVESSLKDILQKLPLAQKTSSLNETSFMNTAVATGEHSYVYGLAESDENESNHDLYQTVMIKPEIKLEQTICQEVAVDTTSSEILPPTHTLISIVPGHVSVVPVVETQVVSSVVEIGTSDGEPPEQHQYVIDGTRVDSANEVEVHLVMDDEEMHYVPV